MDITRFISATPVNDLYSATVASAFRVSAFASDHYSMFDCETLPRELRVLENDHFGFLLHWRAAIITSAIPCHSEWRDRNDRLGGQTIRDISRGVLENRLPIRSTARFTAKTVTPARSQRLRPDSVTADQNGVAVLVDVLAQ